MDFKTNYPYVFVHGMFGYGPGSKVWEFAPYFGLFGGRITEYFNKNGMEAYDAAVGPYSSAWDRACELYAQLTGTTVDYGEAHSKRFGHARFGRKYEKPLVEGWGSEKRINLIGHSFGGTTSRMLASLLAEGCQAEKDLGYADISPLFTGGKADYIYSITTYSTPHNGMTLFETLGKFEDPFRSLIYTAGALTNNTPISKFYDFKFDQFGLTTDPYTTAKSSYDSEAVAYLANSKDNIFYDLSIAGAAEVNSHLQCVPGIYYFSYTGSRTKPMFGANHLPNRDMFFLFKPTAALIGRFLNSRDVSGNLSSDWLANDGIINTVSGLSPDTEPATDFNLVENVRTGIWYKMGTMDMDHLTFCGYGIKHEEISKFYFDHAVGINKLG